MRLCLTLMLIFAAGALHAQSGSDPGEISTAATLPNPMDPDSDGWITSTGSVFTGPIEEAQFELPYLPIPAYEAEPVADVQVASTSCTMYDLSGSAANGAESTYYHYQNPDGIPDNGDELIFFRFRVARLHTNSVGLSILIDTDHAFGFTPARDADPNAVVGNPGFEVEVSVTFEGGPDILVYDVDGLTSVGAVKASYSISTHLQAAYALNQDPACGSRKPGFIDIYFPFSALGVSSTTPIRMAGASSESSGTMLGGNADDIAGVDGNAIASDDDQFIAAMGSYPPFSFGGATHNAPSCMPGTVAINENYANGTAVYTVSASDPDNDPLTYSIVAGNTNAAFAINALGQITVNNASALDFETTSSFALTVRVSDGTLHDDATINITLNDTNEAPTAADATVSLNENSGNGTPVHSVSASDPDNDALTYTITAGNAATAFAINGSGQITVNNISALNFEATSSFTLTVRVTDGTLFDDAIITVNLKDVNETPLAIDATIALDENSASGAAVHTMSASDPDGDALTFSITAGNTSNAFAINSSGQITVNNAAALDFETTTSFGLTLRVSDGTLFDDAVITINLNDINEAPPDVNDPPVAIDATVPLDENSSEGTAVHTLSATDPDGDMLNYSITGGNASAVFAINSSGQITVNNAAVLDFESTPAITLIVNVSDGALSDDAVMTVDVRDVNEAPGITDAFVTIKDGLSNGTVIHKFLSNDPDAGDAATFSIISENSNATFAIDAGSGEVTVNDVDQLNLSIDAVFALTVMVTDRRGLSATAILTIELETVSEPNVIDPLKGFSPNGDGINDFWLIKGIEAFPDNQVKVFNRWGSLVYEARNYDNNNIAWRGVRNAAETTYYFLITVRGLQPINGYVIQKR